VMYGPIVLCRLSRPTGDHGITKANNRGRLSRRPLSIREWPRVNFAAVALHHCVSSSSYGFWVGGTPAVALL
jgi:hypothetical protein